MENIIEKCWHYEASRTQREEERTRGLGDSGTSGFKNIGCYEYEGFKNGCPSRYPQPQSQ